MKSEDHIFGEPYGNCDANIEVGAQKYMENNEKDGEHIIGKCLKIYWEHHWEIWLAHGSPRWSHQDSTLGYNRIEVPKKSIGYHHGHQRCNFFGGIAPVQTDPNTIIIVGCVMLYIINTISHDSPIISHNI